MALWTPANLKVAPRVWWWGPDATFNGSNQVTSLPNRGSDGGTATISLLPTRGTAMNSLDTIKFNVSGQYVSFSVGAISSGVIVTMIFAKALSVSGAGQGYIGRGWGTPGGPTSTDGTAGYIATTGASNSYHAGDGFGGAQAPQFGTSADVFADTTDPHSLLAQLGATNAAWKDGAAVTISGSVTGAFPDPGAATWIFGSTGTSGEFANADILTEMLFDYVPTQDEIDKVVGWAHWQAASTSTLSAGFAFKNAAPTIGDAPILYRNPMQHMLVR